MNIKIKYVSRRPLFERLFFPSPCGGCAVALLVCATAFTVAMQNATNFGPEGFPAKRALHVDVEFLVDLLAPNRCR